MGVNYNPAIVTDGLAGCWDVASARSSPGGGTTWTDLSKNGNNGTLTNGPITAEGINKGVISFDGADDYVSHPTIDTLQSEGWTIMVWLKRTDVSQTGWRTIWRYGSAGAGVLIKSGSQELYLEQTSVSAPAATTFSDLEFTNLDQWYHLTVSADSTKVMAYLDGVASSITSSDTGDRTWSELQSSTYSWSGSIANAVIYNRSLTAAEIKQNYNATKGRFSVTPSIVTENLVLHLDAGDSDSYGGSGTTWTDLVGSYNATLTNGPVYSSSVGGGSFAFDGTNDFVLAPMLSRSTNDSWSIEIWYSRVDTSVSTHIFESTTMSAPSFEGSTTPKFYMKNSDNSYVYVASLSQSNDVWYHIIMSYDADIDEQKLYVNGALQGTNTSVSGDTIDASSNYIFSRNGSRYCEGSLAVFRQYSGPISESEALQNYESQKGRFV